MVFTISGQHLKSSMRIQLGDGISVDNLRLVNEGATMAVAELRVSPSAPAGTRTLNILYMEQIKPTQVVFTVNPLYHPPIIQSVAPSTLLQGRSYTVVVTGMNLDSIKTVNFGHGITVKNDSLDTQSPNSIRLALEVSANAQPGSRMVQAVNERGVTPGRASVIVMAVKPNPIKSEIPKPGLSTKIQKTPGLSADLVTPQTSFQLTGMTPNRWYSGKEYEVTVFGSQLTKDMTLSLGEGITIQDLEVKTPAIATLKIQVDKKAASGPRMLKFRTNQFQAWTATNSQGFVIPLLSTSFELPPIIQHAALKDVEFIKGTIHLRTPEYGNVTTGHYEQRRTIDHGIPIVSDDVEFTWDEEPSGTSHWFEIRILDKDNNILITRKIQGGPPADSFYIPDVAFLTEMFALLRPDSVVAGSGQAQTTASKSGTIKQSVKLAKSSTISNSTATIQTATSHLTEFQDKRIDCYWQVAGFKQFFSYAYSPQAGKNVMTVNNVEIAISERWPLQLPHYSPTGLICSAANTELTPDKVNENTGEAVEDHNFYVGDTLKLSGKFTLDGCPWSIKYDVKWGNPSYGPVADTVQVMSWNFYNVFIDWGDGEYDRVFAFPTQEMLAFEGSGTEMLELEGAVWEPNEGQGKPMGKLNFLMTHTYRYPQKFPVRLFVLPEQDAGRIDSIVQANKSPKGGSVYQAAYQKEPEFFDNRVLLASSIVTASDVPMPVMSKISKSGPSSISNVSKSKPSIMPGFEKPGTSAFLLYCNPTVIDVRPDPFATGRLHLINIGIDQFSGQKAQSDTPIDVSEAFNSKKNTNIPIPGKQTIPSSSKKKTKQQVTLAPQAAEIVANTVNNGPMQLFPTSDAVASSCDEGLYATARLEYYGLGRITLVWEADGTEIGRTDENVGPSPIRTELDQDNNYTESIKHGFMTFVSPNLPLDVGGKSYKKYKLTVKAFLPGNETAPDYPVGATVTIPLANGGTKTTTVEPDESMIEVVRRSAPKTYLVKAPVPGEPCAFKFPVADGQFFIISNIQNRVTKKNGQYSGEGTLYFVLADSPGSIGIHFTEIHINNWTIDDDFMVTDGKINEININMTMGDLPGVSGVLKALKGTAGEPLVATMDVKIKDSGLHRVGAIEPPEWLNTKADLVPQDGWYAPDLAMPETEIYWSDFRISSNDVAIDLSRLRGDKPESGSSAMASKGSQSGFQSTNTARTSKKRPAPKSAKAAGPTPSVTESANIQGLMQSSSAMQNMVLMWAGVDLGKTARLYPFLFNLVEIDVAAKGWNITDNGIQGNARFNKFKYVLGDGDISFDSIDITAENHGLDAIYEGVKINIPWPKVTLDCGRATVHYTQGPDAAQVAFDFDLNNFSVKEEYQNITMTSQIKSFEKRGSGWGILTDTTFDFTDGRNDFTTAVLTDLFFNVYGEAHFTGSGDQAYNRTIPFNQSTTFGDTQYTLAGLNVFATADHQKEERLSFTFNGQIDFHESFNAPDVKVFYKIDKPLGKEIQAMGPGHSDIKICSDFSPGGEKLSRIEVHPELNLPANPGMSDNFGDDNSLISTLISGLVPSAHASSGPQDTFSGQVNAQMFGKDLPGVNAIFRYGTYNNQIYWLTHLKGYTDVTIFSGVNLKEVNGGIGHGFAEDVFTSPNVLNAMPTGSSTLYSAGITIGSPGTEIYSMAGKLTVDVNAGMIRMDCNPVALFGVGLAGGYFKYANSVFDGGVFGGFNLYEGALSCEIPQNEADPRVGLHLGDDYWEIWAGKQQTPLTIKLLNVVGADGYFQFGDKVGFRVGGGMSINSPKLCVIAFAGQASANAGMAMAITPGKLAGSFWIGAKLHVWFPCGGIHYSFGPDIKVNVSAPPLSMNATASFTIPSVLGVGGGTYSFPFDI